MAQKLVLNVGADFAVWIFIFFAQSFTVNRSRNALSYMKEAKLCDSVFLFQLKKLFRTCRFTEEAKGRNSAVY